MGSGLFQLKGKGGMLLHESLQPQGSEGKAIGRLDLGNGAVQAEAETAQQVVGQFPDFPSRPRRFSSSICLHKPSK